MNNTRRIDLQSLAAELDISYQVLSERFRRANRVLVTNTVYNSEKSEEPAMERPIRFRCWSNGTPTRRPTASAERKTSHIVRRSRVEPRSEDERVHGELFGIEDVNTEGLNFSYNHCVWMSGWP